jgi:S1-C subfamily serine protease
VLRSPRLEFFFGGPLADLELAPMNPDLGRYFGTADGVLVVSVPEESTLNLRGGDVILSVDGREPGGPAHLMRILGSYEGGETVEFQIMRDRKRQTVSGKVDARNRPPAVKERVRRRP